MQYPAYCPIYNGEQLMEYRFYQAVDHPMIAKWWESWGWDVLPEIALPTTGIIVTNEGEDIAAVFLYKTDSCVCWAEHFVANKTASRDARKGGVEFLIRTVMEVAKEQGFMMMMASMQHKGLIGKMMEAGCDENSETNMTNLVKVL